MDNKYIKIVDAAKELGLYLKIVTSTSNFNNYNSFFNIYDEYDEACRRIIVITPYKDLEEVTDYKPDEDIIENSIIDGNVWLKEFPLTTNPNKIDLSTINITREAFENIKTLLSNK